MKTTLQDIKKALESQQEKSDRHFYGVVKSLNKTASGKVKSYEVSLGGNSDTMTCRKLAGADVGDTVMVTLTKTGMAVVTGTVDGDKDAEAAMTTAEEAQGAVDTLSETVDTLSDDVDSIEGLVGDGDESGITISTQYYLSTSNAEQVGGEWSDTLPAYVEGRYYWTKTITTYADGSEVESTPILDIASQMTAETNAVATATDQHFWSDSTGAYVTKSNKSLTSGYAMKITTNGLLQTYNGNNLMSLTGSGLSLYQSDGSTLMATYSSGGAYMYAGGSVTASFTSSGVNLYTGSSLAAKFTSSTISLGAGGQHIDINSDAIIEFYATRIGQTATRRGYIGLNGTYNRLDIQHDTRVQIDSALRVTGEITSASSISGSSLSSSGSISGSSLSVTGGVSSATVSASGKIEAATRIVGNKVFAYSPSTGSSGTANCRIITASTPYEFGFVDNGSSRKLKHDVKPIETEDIDPRRLYDAEVIQFVYNTDYLSNEEDCRYDRPIPGFIAEDLFEVYPMAVDIENGEPETWNERYIIPPMLALIQEQKKEIDSIRKELADIKKLIA